jgi:hypothetical protein
VNIPWQMAVQYKFFINNMTWMADPANPNTVPDGFGGVNSLINAPTCAQGFCP